MYKKAKVGGKQNRFIVKQSYLLIFFLAHIVNIASSINCNAEL